jgi:PAS domain S-box-containing protein
MLGKKTAADTVEQEDTRRELDETQTYLDQVLAHFPAGIAVLDGPDFRYSHVNQRLADINGLSVAEHLGKTLAEVLPGAAPDILPRLQRVRDTGAPSPEYEFTTMLPRDPHALRCIVDSCFPIFGDDGSVRAVSVVVLDVTRRNEAESALRDTRDTLQQRVRERTDDLSALSERLQVETTGRERADANRDQADAARHRAETVLARIVEASPDYMWSAKISPAGEFRYHYHSPSVEAMTGYAPSFYQEGPERWLSTVHLADRGEVESRMQRLRSASTGPEEVEYRIVRPDGTIRWISDRTVSNRAPDGTIHLSGVASDITKRTHLREQLAQAQKLETVGRLAGGVAHDFNNLLTVICGHSERLVKQLEAGSKEHRRAESIQRASVRGAALTQRLLAFSRQQPLTPEVFGLAAVLDRVRELLPGLLAEQIELAITADPDLGFVKVDPNQLTQVIVNLAVNARDAMPNGGTLTITARNGDFGDIVSRQHPGAPKGPCGIITVSDTGCGMDQNTLGRIYEPFFTTKEPGKGTGLGLAMAYGVVKDSGGYIDVDSDLGRGSTFTIYLPHTDERPATPSPIDTGKVALGSQTLLVVEDTADVRDIAVETLEDSGFAVLSAGSAAEAIEVVLNHRMEIDLLITDIAMPQMNGVELARRLRTRRPDLPVLFISGHPDDMLGRSGTLEPYTGMLPKPFPPDRLVTKIREMLDDR